MKNIIFILLLFPLLVCGQFRRHTLKFGNISNNISAVTYSTLNPSDKAAGITLSGGNLVMAGCGCAGAEMVRGTSGKSSGKWYFEVTVTSLGSAQIGIALNTETVNGPVGGGAGGYSYLDGGDKYNNNTSAFYGAGYANTNVISVVVDMDAGTLVFWKNGASQGTAYTGLSGTFFPALGSNWSASTLTVNFGASAFSYTPPAGHTGWTN